MSSGDSGGIRISGSSGRPPCQECVTADGKGSLVSAGRHASLKGTNWLRSKGRQNLLICRSCTRLWARYHDRRENFVWYKDLGSGALSVISADSCCRRIVEWTATAMPDTAQGWASGVLTRLLRRQSTCLSQCLEIIVSALREPVNQPSELAAMRRLELVIMCTSVLQSTRSRSSAVGCHPATDEQLRKACERYSEQSTEFSYLGKNRDVLIAEIRRRTRFRQVVSAGGTFLIQANDLRALLDTLTAPLLPGEDRGYARGQRRRVTLQSLCRFHRLATQPPVLSMQPDQWQAIDVALDPVSLLAVSVKACLQTTSLDPKQRFLTIQEEAEVLPSLGAMGARISRSSMTALEKLSNSVRKNSESKFDQMTARLLSELIFKFKQYANGDCSGPPCVCADWSPP